MKRFIQILFVVVFMFSLNSAFAIESTHGVKQAATTQVVKADNNVFAKVLNPTEEGKSQLVALLLAIFVGVIGIHLFYLGYKKKGTMRLILGLASWVLAVILPIIGWLFWLGMWVWSIIDAINILNGKMKPADGDYAEKI